MIIVLLKYFHTFLLSSTCLW